MNKQIKIIQDGDPTIATPQVYEPLPFWFCKSYGYPCLFGRCEYSALEVHKIPLSQVSLDHESREDLETYGTDEVWVPVSFPESSRLDISRAQMVGNLELNNCKYTIIQNNHELIVESFPYIWKCDLRTNEWTKYDMRIKVTFADFDSLDLNGTS